MNVELLLELSLARLHYSTHCEASCVRGNSGDNSLIGGRVLRSCSSPLKTLYVAPPPFILERSSGDAGGQPAGSLLLLSECQNGESGEAGPSDKYAHCSLCTCDRHPAMGMAKGVTLAFKSFLVL